MLWWQRLDKAATKEFLIHQRTAQPFQSLPVTVEDERARASFAVWHASTLDEYAYRFTGGVCVEPQHGYVVRGMRTLLLESMPYYFYGGTPSFARYLTQRIMMRRRTTVHERSIILLRDFEDANYFHFYNDVLAKLRVLAAHGEGRESAIVISRKLSKQRFFQDAMRRSDYLSEKRWIVQDGFFVSAKEAYCVKPLPHAGENFDFALKVLNAPRPHSQNGRRIFLTRGVRRGRQLTNHAEVERVCANCGFDVVDADALSLDEQIMLFAASRFIVGIHGAGLTNIIFRRGAPLALLELFPPGNIPPHYSWICHHYGFAYDALVGTSSAGDEQNFAVDTERLRLKLERLLSE